MIESISGIYISFLKEQYIKDVIKTGRIPTMEEIDNYLLSTVVTYDNLNSPLTRSETYLVEIEEESSAKKMNKIHKDLSLDLSVAIKSILTQGNRITDIYDATYSRLSGINERMTKLKTRAGNLLFESKNSDRHEQIFYEKFESTDMIDLDKTTAEVDILNNNVTLKFSENNLVSIPATSDNIEVIPASNPSIITANDTQGLEVVNILNPSGNCWNHQIKTKEAVAQIYVDVIIRIPSNKTEINKIIISPAMINIKTQVNLELAYSNDKLNWRYPDGEYKKRLTGKTSIDFTAIKAEYWRLRITKFGNDGFFGNSYAYNFGLQNILFIGKSFEKVNRQDKSFVYSKIIESEKPLTAINIRVCNSLPQSTSIRYELAPITESQIVGIQNGTIDVTTLHYYLLNLLDKDSETLDLSRLSAQQIQAALKVNESITYENKKENDYCLDVEVGETVNKADSIIMRCEGDNETVDQDGTLGWNYNGLYYSTYVLVESPEGELIDLGDTRMIINGVSVSGKATLSPGLNNIISPKEHWSSLFNQPTPQEENDTIDPLYPYNHKFLIEGLGTKLYDKNLDTVIESKTFIDVLDPDLKYRIKRKIWKTKMREESFGVFESKDKTTLDIFSYKLDNNTKERIVVKSTSEQGLIAKEKFSVILKIQDAVPIKGLIFKAELLTNNVKSTPVLTEYLLKFR